MVWTEHNRKPSEKKNFKYLIKIRPGSQVKGRFHDNLVIRTGHVQEMSVVGSQCRGVVGSEKNKKSICVYDVQTAYICLQGKLNRCDRQIYTLYQT